MEIKDNYQRWLNHPNLDADLKKELEAMDEKQINDAFYTNVEFGTAGMRGVLGAGTNRINTNKQIPRYTTARPLLFTIIKSNNIRKIIML